MAQIAPVATTAPVPPQNLDAEESVLGAMMLSPGAIGAVSEVLDARRLLPREPCEDLPRRADALRPRRAGRRDHARRRARAARRARGRRRQACRIHELAALVPAAANASHYARIVREMATLRGLIRAGQEIARLGMERPGETTELVDRAEQVVFDLAQARVSTDFSHIEELLKASFERITHALRAGCRRHRRPVRLP